MTFDELVGHISDVCPSFNKFALKDFVKNNINESHEFPALVLREGAKFIKRGLEFVDYEIASPEERVRYELRSGSGKSSRAKIPLTVSHLRLVKYRVKFDGQYIETKLYTPYVYEDMLCINDKKSMIRKVILEKTFSRVEDKDKDGISVSPIRINATFNRKHTFKIASYITGEFYKHFIISAGLFHGVIRNKISEITILHYMLAKFGFIKTLKKFGLNKSDISFVEEVGDDTKTFEYFVAKKYDNAPGIKPALFLKVKKTLLIDDQSLKFVVNVLYILSFFDIQSIDNIYIEEGSIWKVILGIITLSDRAELKAYSNAETHLRSVDYFIDPITRDRFRMFGIMIDDIYDLLVHVFINIDTFMVNNLSQDIYNSKLDVTNGILVKSFGTRLFQNMYYLDKKTNISVSDVKSTLRFNPMMFRMSMSTKKDDSEHYIAPPDIIGDNFLFSGGLNKIRLGGKAEQRLHPSMLVVESIEAFVGKYIGKTGYLNPYVPTDERGAIVHPDYAKDIDAILAYLPR